MNQRQFQLHQLGLRGDLPFQRNLRRQPLPNLQWQGQVGQSQNLQNYGLSCQNLPNLGQLKNWGRFSIA